ncbi:MAG: hypothetical protein RLN88_01985 [Ekhidna sp.]|uniref:hypothetical protein n=1 Tax=Ekhidna sp. TaxID=2608089 RepID=UPI0032EE63D9
MPKENRIDAIMKLTMSEALQSGKFKDFISELIPVVCNSLNAFRVSFWLHRTERDEFESIQCFDMESREACNGEALDKSTFPQFCQTLKSEPFLHIESTNESKELEEFVVDHLLKNKLRSWASIQIWNEHNLFGILAVEWKANKDFTEVDQMIMVTAASLISRCYDALLRLKEDFLHRSELSSLKGEEKEKEKLARKLSDHAFYTSHSIRHPLSTILALIDLIKLNWENREAYEELLQQLKIETMNLDDAIRVMTAKIELD